MIEENLSKETIRDYIIENYPQTKFWDSKGKHEFYSYNKNYEHRQGLPNEIRIEFDSPDITKNFLDIHITGINLYEAGYSFAVYYVDGGRSPHIHIYGMDELDTLKKEKRELYRKLFLKKYCPENSKPDEKLCQEEHLLALEFANHFKYNKQKKLVHNFYQGKNMALDYELLCMVRDKKVQEKKRYTKKIVYKKLGDQLKNQSLDIIINALTFEIIFDKFKIKFKGKMALCPFHNDANLSLSFNEEKKIWHCFGCEEKGTILDLINKLGKKHGKF